MRVNITLACTECGERNYITKKNKRNNPDRVEFKKYCSRDKKQTLHRETKVSSREFSCCFFFDGR
ncbi:50S ribosomal protein L33 1 [Bacillus safensis]|uniref:Large ribosomal subunit protein bL33 n=10 Tax=Bacillus TaxID=1386 RepID=A0A5S9MF06_BACIA|nr:50S ribosomal protein L33 1 [Bacillus safensis]